MDKSFDEKRSNDKAYILKEVKKNWESLKYASDELRNDKEVVLAAVKNRGIALEYASDELRNDKEVVLAAVKNRKSLKYASDELRNDKEVVLAAVKNRKSLKYASDELRNDKEVVLAAVKNWGITLEYASDELRNDKEVVLAAVKNWGDALKYASDELKNDKEVVLEAVKNCGDALKYASDELRNDKEVVLAAVKKWGDALNYASDELKNDKEVVLEAVKTASEALSYASEALRNDKDIVLEAICCDTYNFLYASEALRNNQDIIIQFLKHFHGDLVDEQFTFITLKKFQNNKTLMHLAKENNPEFLSTLNYAIKEHEEGVIDDIKEWGADVLEDNYEYLTEPNRNEMFSNKEFVMKALKVDINVYKYVSEELKNDIDVISETLRNEYYDEDLDKKLLTNEAILFEIIRKDFNIITYLDDNIVEAHREGIYQNFIKSKNQFFDINSKTILFDMDEGEIHFNTLNSQKVFEQYATFKFSEYDKKVSITNLHIDIEPYKDRYISSFNVVNKEGITVAKMIANYPYSLDSFSSSKLEIVEYRILNDELYLLIKLTSNRFTFFGRAATSLFTKRQNENFDTFEYYDDDDDFDDLVLGDSLDI